MKTRKTMVAIFVSILAILFATPIFAQAPPPPPPPPPSQQAPPPPTRTPAELDQMVARIALYPDSLLAQVLAAATYPDQITDAAHWADQHHYLTGQALADAIQGDQLYWDPSVQALLPFPSVLDMMASDMNWTTDIGNAFLAQQQDVMDAVQYERHQSYNYGYLRSNSQVVVGAGPYITIAPLNPAFVVVPAYDPAIVFFAPRPGFVVGGAIHFGYGVTIGTWFRPWGWGAGFARFDWGGHAVFVNNVAWHRTWYNRAAYVHPYPMVHRYAPGPRAAEHHALEQRSDAERRDAREGRARVEEHRDERRDRR